MEKPSRIRDLTGRIRDFFHNIRESIGEQQRRTYEPKISAKAHWKSEHGY